MILGPKSEIPKTYDVFPNGQMRGLRQKENKLFKLKEEKKMNIKILPLVCPNCSGHLNIPVSPTQYTYECPMCGTNNLVVEAAENPSGNPELLLDRGIRHLAAGNYDRALRMFNEMIDCTIDNGIAYKAYLGAYLSEYCMGRFNTHNKANAIHYAPDSVRKYLGNLEIRDLEKEQKDIARLEYLNRTSSPEHLKTQYEKDYVNLIDKQKNQENVMLTKIEDEKEELRTFKRKSRFQELTGLIKNFFLGILSGLKSGMIFGAITIIPYIVIFAVATGNSGVNEYWNEHWLDPFFIACLIIIGLSGIVTLIKKQYAINSDIKAKIASKELRINESYAALNSIKTMFPKKIDELNIKYERLQSAYEKNRLDNAPEMKRLEQRIALSQSLNSVEYYYPLLSVMEEN